MKKVLVSGITGHLGYTLAKALIEKGYLVRGCMRKTERLTSMPHLRELNIEIVEADVTDFEKMKFAMRGMDGYFHVAAVYSLTSSDPQKEIIDANVLGTENALKAAAATGIKKVIYTSSIAAVGTIAPGEKPKNEVSWNLASEEPYALSKALSEKKAWDLSNTLKLPLVSVLPGTIIGPGFYSATPSVDFLLTALAGGLPVAPPLTFNYVDVRDIAEAHIRVYENDEAHGRYLATDKMWAASDVLTLLKELRPDLKYYGKTLPLFLAKLIPTAERIQSKLFGTAPSVTSASVKEYFGREQAYESQRLRRETGWSPRPFRESLSDTLEWIRHQVN